MANVGAAAYLDATVVAMTALLVGRVNAVSKRIDTVDLLRLGQDRRAEHEPERDQPAKFHAVPRF